jgi:hypothetical protein
MSKRHKSIKENIDGVDVHTIETYNEGISVHSIVPVSIEYPVFDNISQRSVCVVEVYIDDLGNGLIVNYSETYENSTFTIIFDDTGIERVLTFKRNSAYYL